MKRGFSTLLALTGVVLVLTANACFYSPQKAYVPPPDPSDLMRQSAAEFRDVRSFKFELTHRRGSIYYRDATGSHIKATDIEGEWHSTDGMTMDVDAYLVRNQETEATDGTYFPIRMVLVPHGIYLTDPLSGQWLLQSPELAIIRFELLNEAVAALLLSISSPSLEGEETIDGRETYEVSGSIPATAVSWLPIEVGASDRADISLWVDREDNLPRRVLLIGAIGQDDDPGTVRELSLSDFGERVRIEPPGEYVDIR